jgi:hypothetical protein
LVRVTKCKWSTQRERERESEREKLHYSIKKKHILRRERKEEHKERTNVQSLKSKVKTMPQKGRGRKRHQKDG